MTKVGPFTALGPFFLRLRGSFELVAMALCACNEPEEAGAHLIDVETQQVLEEEHIKGPEAETEAKGKGLRGFKRC